MPTFNLLIATVGRPSLERQLKSVVNQLSADDCLTVVFDGCPIQDLQILKGFACPVDLYSEPVALGHWGHEVRNKYAHIMQKRDFVMHGDDDDIYVANAIASLRKHCTDIAVLYIAKMCDIAAGGIIPRDNSIYLGNIGTPCGIVPWEVNSNSNVKWELFRGGDCRFYENASNYATITFLDQIIYVVRPPL